MRRNRFEQLEIVRPVVEARDDLGQIDHLAIGPREFAGLDLESSALQALQKGQQDRHGVFIKRARGTLVADRQEAFQVADDRHRGLQPGSVIAVHCVQAPCRDHLRLYIEQRLFRPVGELKRQFGVGGGGTARPFEDEVLTITRHPGQYRRQLVGADKGKFGLEVVIETRDNGVGVEGLSAHGQSQSVAHRRCGPAGTL